MRGKPRFSVDVRNESRRSRGECLADVLLQEIKIGNGFAGSRRWSGLSLQDGRVLRLVEGPDSDLAGL